MLSDAPLLGNGEVGVMAEHDGNRLSYYVGRADFRRYALGGVDLLVKASKVVGKDAPSSRHEQDIERAEIRSKVELAGRMVETTTWLVPDQALMICEVHNPSAQALTMQVKTWTRAAVNDFSEPFRLKAGHLSTYPVNQSLNDRDGKVVYGKPVLENAELWRYFKEGNIWCLKNEATGRYMAMTDKGEVITTEKPDTAYFRRMGRERQGMVQWAANGYYLNAPYKLGANFFDPAKPLPVQATRTEAPYATATEAAAHFYNAKYAEHVDDLTWASRSYSFSGTRSSACLVSRVLDAKAAVQDATQEVVIPAKGRITLAVAMPGAINHEKRTPPIESLRDKGLEMLRTLTPEKIQFLKQQRLDHWRKYWLKAWVDTGDDLLNKYWFGSMYLLHCANQIGQQSPALLGVWNMSDNPACTNREFNNYNYQSQHYATFTANRADCAIPQLDDILKTLPWAQGNAARAGYQGAMWTRTVSQHLPGPPPTAFPQPAVAGRKDRNKLPNDQLDVSAFLAMNFLYAYETSLDRELLEKKVYPMARTCMDFYEDYLYLNEKKNRYELPRSAAREATTDNNPAYPLAFIKRLATACSDYSEVLGVDADKRDKWRDIAKRMSEYPTTTHEGKTVFRETESNPRIALQGPGDNVSLLQIIHPGEGIGLDSDPKLLEIAHNTLAYMNSDPESPSWMQIHNNLPLIFTQAATIGWDSDDLFHWLHHYMEERLRPNLTPQPWGMESVGGTEAIHRMMFQSRDHVLRFFPVWPKTKDASFTRLRGFGAFLVSAHLKGSVVGGINIFSEKGTPCSIVNPWPGKEVQVIRNGQKAELVRGERFTLKTSANETIELQPK